MRKTEESFEYRQRTKLFKQIMACTYIGFKICCMDFEVIKHNPTIVGTKVRIHSVMGTYLKRQITEMNLFLL